MEEGTDDQKLSVDREELIRYLNGEISFTEWQKLQGQDVMQLLSSEEQLGAEDAPEEGADMDEDASDESDEEEEEHKDAEEERENPEGERGEDDDGVSDSGDGEEEGEGDLRGDDDEYVPPRSRQSAYKPRGKVGRPRKPPPEQLTPKRGRGRPRKDRSDISGLSSTSQDNSPLSHEMRLGRAEKRQLAKRGRKKGHSRVPKGLQGLMGEAHLCFARGGHQEAIKMCLEIIRQVPRCPDPYQLLSMIYEDKQDMEKSLQFSLIACHLNPSDSEEWTRCAETCLEQDDIDKAIHCYSKAIRYNPSDLSNHMERIHLYEQLQDKKKVLDCYQVLLKALPEDQGEQYMQLAKDIVKAHHQDGDIKPALEIIETAFSKYPHLIRSEDVNILAELHIVNRKYQQALQVMSDHCGVIIKSKDDNSAVLEMEQLSLSERDNGQDIMDVTVPEGLPIDLIAKLGVCLIHCKQFQTVKGVVEMLSAKSPNEMGDLYLDVAEAYIDLGHFVDALSLLEVLVDTENYNLAAVWLRYAECLTSLGELGSAANAYRQVLQKVPNHLDARIALAMVERKRGNEDVALEILSVVSEDHTSDVQVVRQRSLLLYSKGFLKEFIQDGLLLLRAYVKDAYQHHGGSVSDNQLCGNLSHLDHDEWYTLYCKTLRALVQTGQLAEAQTLSNSAIVSKRFGITLKRKLDVEFMGVCVCFLNKNYKVAYDEIRHFLYKYPNCAAAWNFFSYITNLSNDTRHHRFCLRLTINKLQNNFALCILNGHNAMVSGSFKNAVGEYVRGFRQRVDDPFVNMMIGVSIAHMACQRFTIKRNSLFVQAFAFLKRYEEYRGVCQETCYNIGRTLHQIGLLHMAARYYHKGLELPPSTDDPRFDLRAELAFNLSLIYRHSGNEEMAIELLSNTVI
ncbi:general transcription factor 3C polypeptide 3-like isoform X2 [Asterias amurensis]|uniref:general transcription factor 3C polypeptide 3-like isoform X2 n=1 Tax=Asterias amurensis TaxID=7602 RepID=UPI003AB2D77C